MIKKLGLTLLLLCTLLACSQQQEEGNKKSALDLAAENLKSNNFSKTLAVLRNISDDQLKTKEYYLMQGLSSFKLGDFKKAIRGFEKAKPESMELKIYIAYLYLLRGDADRAKQLANQIEAQFGPKPKTRLLKGNISLKEHAYRDAEEHYRFAIRQDKNFTKGYIGLGNTFLLQRAYIKAEEHYLKAVFLSKDDPVAYIALANFYIAMSRYAEAENNLKHALEIYPNNPNILITLAAVYIKTDNDPAAMEIYNRALKKFPDSLDLRTTIVKAYLRLGKLEKAHEMIQVLLGREDENYYGLILLGEYFLRKNDLDASLANFNRALIINQNSYEINYYLGLIHLLQNKPKLAKKFLVTSVRNYPGFTNAHLLLAIISLSSNQYKLASGHSKLVLQLDPKNIGAHAINGLALFLRGEVEEAQYEFDVVEEFEPENLSIPLFRALTALSTGHLGTARAEISKIDFKFAQKLFLEFELFKLLGTKEQEIERRLKTYLNHEPGFITLILIGNFYREKESFNTAIKYFESSIRLNGNSVISHYLLSEAESKQGNLKSAISHLNKVIEINPLFLKSYQALGSLYERIKDYDNAKLVYEKGLNYHPDDSMMLNNLAWILLTHFKDKTSAYFYIRKAVAESAEDIQINDTLAWWYYFDNQYEQATNILKDIIKIDPENPIYRYHLGMAYYKNGENRLGIINLKKALELDKNHKHMREIKETLKL